MSRNVVFRHPHCRFGHMKHSTAFASHLTWPDYAAAVQAGLNGLPVDGYIAILAAFLVLALMLAPLAAAAALRLAVSGA